MDQIRKNLERHLTELCLRIGSRHTGSAGEKAAADYLEKVFREKGIEAWCDFWGHDVSHDWPWWFKQMRYFLPFMLGSH